MKTLSNILAKSKEYGGTTLLEHTQHVLSAIEVFSREFDCGTDLAMARKAAVLHDLGKAHPHFQRKIQGIKAPTLFEEKKWDFIHRHELSSLGFLPVFPKSEWNILIDMVVAHHKSIKNDKRRRGILDLENESDAFWKKNHLMDWEEWSPYGLQILEYFGYPTRTISKIDAQQALEYVLDYCENKKLGWSPMRGLLMSADHFGSAFIDKTKAKLSDLFAAPDLAFYHRSDRKHDLYPLSKIDTDNIRPHTIVVAPTGAGKTDFLLKRCKGRIFYTLPFQASIKGW